MTVSNLTLSGPVGTTNRLFLTDAGASTPLHVLNNFSISTNGAMATAHSALRVDGALFNIDGSVTNMGGGLIIASNATLRVGDIGRGNFTALGASSSQFWSRHVGEGCHEKMLDAKFWKEALTPASIPDEELWALRTRLRRELLEFARKRVRQQLLRYGSDESSLAANFLSPDALTIGFARRDATYKRGDLLFHDLEWLKKISAEVGRFQLIYAGKAHPHDGGGQDLIKRIFEISQMPQVAGKVIFLENYDIELARYLVRGVDIWLNTPTSCRWKLQEQAEKKQL